jgi:hypothetical protein
MDAFVRPAREASVLVAWMTASAELAPAAHIALRATPDEGVRGYIHNIYLRFL